MGYVSNSIWHCFYDGKKITGKVTLLEDLANTKEIVTIDTNDLKHIRRSHLFSLYKFILNKRLNVDNGLLNKDYILGKLLDLQFADVDLQYPIYILKIRDKYTVILDGNRRLDRAFLTNTNTIKAKVFYLEELIGIIRRHNLNI